MRRPAKEAIQNLMKLGWSQKRIASEAKVAESTISRALNDPNWAIGRKVVESLRRLEISARRDLVGEAIRRDGITIVEACHRSHVALTDKVRAQAGEMVRAMLANEVAGKRQPVVWPAGMQGFLARVGESGSCLFVIAVDPNLDEDGARVLAHELRHVADRLCSERPKGSTARYVPESAY